MHLISPLAVLIFAVALISPAVSREYPSCPEYSGPYHAPGKDMTLQPGCSDDDKALITCTYKTTLITAMTYWQYYPNSQSQVVIKMQPGRLPFAFRVRYQNMEVKIYKAEANTPCQVGLAKTGVESIHVWDV